MSKQDKTQVAPEIVIVRRKRGGGDECHHGGVWKVAYADFMTAMMAFFLVMWLINAANEETRSQVASYFNPVKLVDTTTNPRGLQESKDSSSGDVENKELKSEALAKSSESPANANDDKKQNTERKKGPATYFSGGDIPESELFRDPLRTLDKIAGGAPDILKGAARNASRARTLGASGGAEFRDPFSPRSWQRLEKSLPRETQGAARATAVAPSSGKGGGKNAKTPPPGKTAEAARSSLSPSRAQDGRGGASGKAGKAARDARALAGEEKTLADIQRAVRKLVAGKNSARMPGVVVKRTAEGILITLADKAGFGMFEVGSAKPRRETVRFMDKIAAILRGKPGSIIVRGHTDGRPFRTALYDNWRLSTARAHAARYMLLRGGIDEKRILRVEGHADRRLAVPGDPLAARNRRIEILLKEN